MVTKIKNYGVPFGNIDNFDKYLQYYLRKGFISEAENRICKIFTNIYQKYHYIKSTFIRAEFTNINEIKSMGKNELNFHTIIHNIIFQIKNLKKFFI